MIEKIQLAFAYISILFYCGNPVNRPVGSARICTRVGIVAFSDPFYSKYYHRRWIEDKRSLCEGCLSERKAYDVGVRAQQTRSHLGTERAWPIVESAWAITLMVSNITCAIEEELFRLRREVDIKRPICLYRVCSLGALN
jgi:hypothetical protein